MKQEKTRKIKKNGKKEDIEDNIEKKLKKEFNILPNWEEKNRKLRENVKKALINAKPRNVRKDNLGKFCKVFLPENIYDIWNNLDVGTKISLLMEVNEKRDIRIRDINWIFLDTLDKEREQLEK